METLDKFEGAFFLGAIAVTIPIIVLFYRAIKSGLQDEKRHAEKIQKEKSEK